MMARRSAQLDLYAVLQVSPRASAEEIAAAHDRLMARYAPEHTAHAAPEVRELAAQRRAQIAAAYAVLGDPERRAAYDRRNAWGPPPESLDYRPLPPARGVERVHASDESPAPLTHTAAQRGTRSWLPPLALILAALSLVLALVLSGVRTSTAPAALATPTIPGVALPFTPVQIAQFRAAAETVNDFDPWRALGNAIFDNMQTLRENAPLSPQYRHQLDDWLEAVAAYERALQVRDDEVVRSDRALALFTYGRDSGQSRYVEQAIAVVEHGIAQGDSAPRALINYGLILASLDPPRIDEAIELWERVLRETPEAPEAQRVEALIRRYARE